MTVNSKGRVTCKKAGTAYVIIKVGETKNYKGITKKVKVKVKAKINNTFPSARKGTYWSELTGSNYYEYITVKSIRDGKVYIEAGASYNEGGRMINDTTIKNAAFNIIGKNKAYNASLGLTITWSGNSKLRLSGNSKYVTAGTYKK